MAEGNMLMGNGGIDTSIYRLPAPQQPVNMLTGVMQAQQAAQQATTLQQSQFDLGKARFNALNQAFGALAGMKNPTFENVAHIAGQLVASKMFSAEEIAPTLSAWRGLSSDQIRARADDHAQQMASYVERMQSGYGAPTTMNVGDKMLSGSVDPRSGAFRPAGQSQDIGMSPEAKAARVNGVAGGVPFSAPQSSFVDRGGYALPAPTAPQAGAGAPTTMAPRGVSPAPVSVSQAPPPIAGAPAPRGYTTMQPAGPPLGAPAMPGFPAGAVQSQQGPGVDATANAQAVANQDRARQLQEAAGRAPEIKAVLDRMQAHAESFAGGPASPYLKQAGGLINQGATLAGFQPPITSQAAREGFDKDAAMLAGMQAGALGGTDASKQMASLMTPSSLNTPEGVRNLLAAHRGNQDAMMAKAQAWDAYRSALPSGQADYAHFENAFNKTFSPLAFSLPYVSKAERQKIWNAMPAGDQARVQQAYDEAKKKGYLRGPASTAPEPR